MAFVVDIYERKYLKDDKRRMKDAERRSDTSGVWRCSNIKIKGERETAKCANITNSGIA